MANIVGISQGARIGRTACRGFKWHMLTLTGSLYNTSTICNTNVGNPFNGFETSTVREVRESAMCPNCIRLATGRAFVVSITEKLTEDAEGKTISLFYLASSDRAYTEFTLTIEEALASQAKRADEIKTTFGEDAVVLQVEPVFAREAAQA